MIFFIIFILVFLLVVFLFFEKLNKNQDRNFNKVLQVLEAHNIHENKSEFFNSSQFTELKLSNNYSNENIMLYWNRFKEESK